MRAELTRGFHRPLRCAWLLGALAGLTACSAAPVTPAPAASSSPAATASVPATSVPSTPAAATSPASPGPEAAASVAKPGAKPIPSGYKQVKRGGKEMYCRSIVPIGSRLAEEVCFTREQLEEIASRTDSALGDIDQDIKVCSGGTCVNQ